MDIIKHGLLSLLVFALWIRGLTDGSDVTQTDTLWKFKGDRTTINCRHTKGAGYNYMYWFRQLPGETMKLIVSTSLGMDNHDFGNFSKEKFSATKPDFASGTFTVNNLKPEDKGLYFCAVSKRGQDQGEAYFGQGTKLTVLEVGKEITGPTVKVLQPSPKECKNEKDQIRKKTLVCVATEFYPDHVSVYWQISGENITDGVATDEAAQWIPGEKFYQITSRLRVPAEEWENSDNKFQCIVNFFNGSATVPYSDSIYGEASTTANKMTREKYLKITQTAKLTYGVFIAKSCIYGAFVLFLVWKLQGSKGKQKY